MDKQIQYLQTCLPAAEKAGGTYDMNPVVILAQGALESGWGTSHLAREHHNYFGIMGYGASNGYWHGERAKVEGTGGVHYFRHYAGVEFSFLDFARTVGKHITVNYMMAKDSVQKRLNGEARDGLSFTEFTYQLLQGYDFLHLYETKNCKLQLGGSDQWGNITTGAELIRRTNGGEVFALTCPLVTKADGTKFGKTESGNVWLDARYTSPYKFYQFWLNVSDEDAKRYIKIFTSISKEEIEALSAEHDEAPHLRVLQKRLAKEVTVMVHSEADYEAAVEASNILFGNSTSEQLHKLDEDTLLAVFEGVPQFEISRDTVLAGIPAVELTTEVAAIFPSKGEMRKLTQGGGVSINKEKLAAPDTKIDATYLLNNKYIIVQRGKKNYYLLIAK